MTLTLPGTQTRDLSLRSTSVHIVNSLSSLVGVEQFADALGILDRVAAAADRAADRAGLDALAFDADIHFGRGGDQELALAEIDQRAVGRRVGLAQPMEDHARRVGAGIREELPGDDLEEIAAHKGSLGAADQRGIFARLVVALGGGVPAQCRAVGGRRGRRAAARGRAAGTAKS